MSNENKKEETPVNAVTPSVTYFPEYRIYKPKNDKTGAASKLQLKIKHDRYREVYLFWEAAQQIGLDANGNASFAWAIPEKKITFKLESVDIGEILAVLNGKKDFAGMPAKDGKGGAIFHQNEKGNTVFKFQKMEKDGNVTYWLQITSKKKDGKLTEVKHTISCSEGEVLKVLLTDAISCMYNWR
jgi:hypothetical protein